MTEIEALRDEIAALRREIAELRLRGVVHHYHHAPSPLYQPSPGYPYYPTYPVTCTAGQAIGIGLAGVGYNAAGQLS